MISSNVARIAQIQTGTNEYTLYRKLISKPDQGHIIIGNGEAAAIAMAKEKGGILASNNLRDVAAYVAELKNVCIRITITEQDILQMSCIKNHYLM